MNLEEVKQAVKDWNKQRTSPESVLSYFKQGCCFKIEKLQYEQWRKLSPVSLHAYMAVFNGVLKIVLIDNESDKDPAAHKDSIFVQDYLLGIDIEEQGFIERAKDGNITVCNALKKMARWNIFLNSWVYNTVDSPYGIFQAFLIPFSDLVAQFEDSPNTESIVLFGLSYENEADLLLWGLNSPNGRKLIIGDPYDSPVENLVCPVPPFGSEEMGLLQ